jgi:hypothetical protein
MAAPIKTSNGTWMRNAFSQVETGMDFQNVEEWPTNLVPTVPMADLKG